MQHLLDNPTFHALSSGNKEFAAGDDIVKYFPAEIAPFAGMIENSAVNFERFYNLAPHGLVFALISPIKIDIPGRWKTTGVMNVLQMVHDNKSPSGPDTDVVPLNEAHADEMVALTKLTNPGPFSRSTLAFGNYKGIFKGDALVAMAGYRLNVYEFREVSAVCTHPDHVGKGYAKKLLLDQVFDIQQAGETAFLHVKSENERAVKLYKHLGFTIRKEMYVCTITKGS